MKLLQLQGQAHPGINKLKDELSFCEDSWKNFMALQGQYTDVENKIRNFKEKNKYLSLQVAAKSKKLQRNIKAISVLKRKFKKYIYKRVYKYIKRV